ncbi:LAFA_0A01200g1_1 [Lachancea sp. 'fantastica']|nr:LAFA_0A01200g1_1 [Lachancea sp. 'fantastica']
MKLLISFFRRLRSVLVLCVTVSVLLYYRFQNEVNTLNSYAETESLPQINKQGPVVPNTAFLAGQDAHNNLGSLPNAASPVVLDEKLRDPKVLLDKNRYFPLIHKQKDVLSIYPELEFDTREEATTSKPQYAARYAASFKNPLTAHKAAKSMPRLQSLNFHAAEESKFTEQMASTVRDHFLSSWKAYSRLALGSDEVKPISRNPTSNGLSRATTMLESLDMLYMLNQTHEISKVLTFISNMDFTRSEESLIDVSQSTQRILGALLSSYELSDYRDGILLTKATELADFLLESFNTPNRIPLLHFPWRSKLNNRFPFQDSSIGELGSLSVEFLRLSQLKKDEKYAKAVAHIYETVFDSLGQFDIDFLLPTHVDATGCQLIPKERLEQGEHVKVNVMKSILDGKYVHCLQTDKFTAIPGTRSLITADNKSLPFYSNMIKFYQLSNGADTSGDLQFSKFLVNSFDRIRRLMTFTPALPNSDRHNLSFVNSLSTVSYHDTHLNEEIVRISPDYTMHHSSCALASSFALMGKLLDDERFLDQAKAIARGCVHMYKLIGVMPESAHVAHCAEQPCDFNNPSDNYQKSKVGEQLITPGVKVENSNDPGKKISDSPTKVYVHEEEQRVDPIQSSASWDVGNNLPKYIDGANPRYDLFPEVIESLFYLYRITGDESWRQLGQDLWILTLEAVDQPSAKGVGKVSALENVFTGERLDLLPSDWFSRHLKFYYLLFQDPQEYALDDYIFTNGGHLLKKPPVAPQAEVSDKHGNALASLIEHLNVRVS